MLNMQLRTAETTCKVFVVLSPALWCYPWRCAQCSMPPHGHCCVHTLTSFLTTYSIAETQILKFSSILNVIGQAENVVFSLGAKQFTSCHRRVTRDALSLGWPTNQAHALSPRTHGQIRNMGSAGRVTNAHSLLEIMVICIDFNTL